MKTLLRLIFCLFIFTFNACAYVSAKVPEEFIGSWKFVVEKQAGFPWWDQIKYPVNLLITEEGITFTDQGGFDCAPKIYFYDSDLKAVVFKHCFPAKSADVIAPFYLIRHEDGLMVGETWTYKLLFKWVQELGSD